MSGKILPRLNESMLALLQKEHADYFTSFYEQATGQDEALAFRMGSEDARTETEKLPNGDLRVSIFLPLDTNSKPTDGRLYVVDRYTFQDANHKKFSFDREVLYNQRGAEKGKWRSLRDFLADPKNARLPTPEQQNKFAEQVALSFSRPIDSEVRKKIKIFSGEEAKHLEEGGEPYYFFPILTGAEQARLSLRIKDGDKLRDQRAHITRIEKGNGYEIVFSYVLNDDDPNTQGRLMVQDRFIFLDMDQPVAFKRDVVVANGSPAKENWEKVRQKFYQADGITLRPELMPTEAGWKKFFSSFKAELLRFEPNFTALAADQKEEMAAEFVESNRPAVSVEEAMERMAENKRFRPAGDYEPELSFLLGQQDKYFATLSVVGGEEFPLETDRLPLDVQVQVKGEETFVKLRYRFADPSFDGVPRGQITLTETFHYKGKTLEGVERHSDLSGPDPDGRLAAVWVRLQQKQNGHAFPEKDNPLTKNFLNQILPYLAPHVLEKPGEVALLDQKGGLIYPQQKEILESLKKIEAGLVQCLYQPDIDPQYRNKILRAIRSSLYQKAESEREPNPLLILADLNKQEGGRLEPLWAQLEAAQRSLQPDENLLATLNEKIGPIQDRYLLTEILKNIWIGRSDKAAAMLPRFSSPQLRRLMDETLGPLQRKKQNHEALELMEAVALDLIAKEARDSDKWFGGKVFHQGEAEKSLRSLVAKAQKQVDLADAASPIKVLETLQDLTGGEKAERSRLFASPILAQLNNIAQEKVRDSQGRQYFTFARRTLMEAGLVTSANVLGKWVALHHMPPTRSLEGLNVLEALAQTQLQMQQAEGLQEKMLEQSKIAWALQPELLAQLSPEEGEKIKKDFEEKYGDELARVARDLNLLIDVNTYSGMTPADQEAFKQQIIERYGPKLLADQALLFNTQFLGAKFQQVAASYPEKNFKELLMGLTALQPGEDAVRQAILQDPHLAALMEQNKAATPEAQQKAFEEIFGLVVGGISERLNQAMGRPILEKIKNDLGAMRAEMEQEMMPGYFLRAQAQGIILSKARDKAVSRPEMNPLDVVALISNEELDKDLEVALQKLDPEDKDFEESKHAYTKIYKEAKAQRKFLADMSINKAFAKIFGEPNAVKRQISYEKLFSETMARVNYLEMLLGQKLGVSEEIPEEVHQSMLAQANYSPEVKALLEAVMTVEDEQGFQSLVGKIQASPDFQYTSFHPVMAVLNQQLAMGDLVTHSAAEVLEAKPDLSEEEQVQWRMMLDNRFPSHDLAHFVAQTEGTGSTAYKIEYGVTGLLKEVTQPTMLTAMTGAMALGALAEGALLARMGGLTGQAFTWGNRGAIAGAVATEGLVLNTGHKILDSAFITRQGQWDHWWGEQKTTWLTFGLWRVGQGAIGQFGREILATGNAGRWAGGPVAVRDIPVAANPVGRLQIPKVGADGTVYQMTRLGSAVEGLAQHGVGIGSIMASHDLAHRLDWGMEAQPKGFTDRLLDATAFYATGLIGAKVAQGLPLGGMHRSIAAMRYQSERLRLEKSLGKTQASSGIPELVDLQIFTQHLEALQKRAEEISKERAVPTLPAEAPLLRLALESLIGPEAVREMEFKMEDGKVWIKDSRKAGEKGKSDIHIDGKALARDQWQAIPENIPIKTPAGEFRLGQTASQEITPTQLAHLQTLQALSAIPLAKQHSLARVIAGAKDLAGMEKSLDGFWSSLLRHGESAAGTQLSHLVRWVQMGAYPLEALPTQLGLRSKVEQLMEAGCQQWRQAGVDLDAFALKEGLIPKTLHPVQANYVKARYAHQLGQAIRLAKGLENISEVLSKSALISLEGVSVNQLLTDLPGKGSEIRSLGLRQKILDLQQDPASIPGLPHPRTMNRLVRNHLDARTPEDLAATQNILRFHIDQMTQPARVMFKRGVSLGGLSPKHQQGLIELYLGAKGVRDVASEEAGLEIISAMSQSRVPFRLTLSKEPIAGGGFKTVLRKGAHPLGSIPLARTRDLTQPGAMQVDRVLWNPNELEGLVTQWKAHLETSQNPITEFRSLLLHPKGRMSVHLRRDGSGKIKMDLNYSFRRPKEVDSASMEKAEKALQSYLKDLQISDVDIQLTHTQNHTDQGNPTGWHRVRPYIPKLPPLPAAVHIPPMDFSLKGMAKRSRNLLRGKTGKKPAEVPQQGEVDSALRGLEAEAKPVPEIMSAQPEGADAMTQVKAEIQITAIHNLNQALARIGRFTEGQRIGIAVQIGGIPVALSFEVDLSLRQVRLRGDAVSYLKGLRDSQPDPLLKARYEGLMEMQDQPFSLPGVGN